LLDVKSTYPIAAAILLLVGILGFAGCASTGVLRPEDEIYPHPKASVRFIVPSGWRVSREEHQAEFEAALLPATGERVVISLVSYRNTWESQSEQKSAQNYLDYIHHDHDPHAFLQIVGSFETARYGLRHVYQCCCDYDSFVNEWLVVFLTEDHNGVAIDVWTPTCGDTLRYKPAIEAIARSVTINAI
jgi:hypothetical protein